MVEEIVQHTILLRQPLAFNSHRRHADLQSSVFGHKSTLLGENQKD